LEWALRLAQAWLCEQGPGPCDACPSCHLAIARSHPDLRVVMPEAVQVALQWQGGEGDRADAETSDGESRSKRKPSKEIKVEAVRQAIDWAHSTSGRGRGKVLVFHPADAMNTVSANALLKTLEEPAPGMRLLLCVNDPAHLLPTIRSRCQRVRLAPPAEAEALTWLAGQGVADAEVLLRAAGGEPLAALQTAQAGLTAAIWAALPGQVAQGDGRVLFAMAVPEAVRALQQICHDTMARLAGGAPRFFPASAVPHGGDWAELTQWSRALVQAARHEDHPWNAGLLLESLLAQGQTALQAGGGPRPPATRNPRASGLGTLRP
jgi:DNA polymerase-3 subunit delta'